jgi:uncharacterized membrane protein
MALNNVSRWLVVILAVLALVGFADSTYLAAEHFRGVVPPCSVVSGCEKVLTSDYAVIGGVPLAVVGMVYYGILLVLIVAFFDTRNWRFLRAACWIIIGGFVGTMYLFYLQAFVLHAFCFYCLISATVSTLLASVSIRIIRY